MGLITELIMLARVSVTIRKARAIIKTRRVVIVPSTETRTPTSRLIAKAFDAVMTRAIAAMAAGTEDATRAIVRQIFLARFSAARKEEKLCAAGQFSTRSDAFERVIADNATALHS